MICEKGPIFSKRFYYLTFFTSFALQGLAFKSIHCKDLLLNETRHDFGLVKSPWDQKYAFIFSNVGDKPLTISDIKTPCGCASPVWVKRPVMPGKIDSFTIKISPRIIFGEFEKKLAVIYNDHQDTAYITVAGNVELEQRF